MPDAVIIVDKTGKIVQTNVQAKKLFGYSVEMKNRRITKSRRDVSIIARNIKHIQSNPEGVK